MKDRMNWKGLLKKFWNDEEGQSTTEYILILAVVVMIAMKFKDRISKQILKATDDVGNNIDRTLSEINNQ